MKSLKKNVEELMFLFGEVQGKNSTESKRLQKVNKGLMLLHGARLEKVKVFEDLTASYSNFRACVTSDIWENWVVRMFLHAFHVCRRKKLLTQAAYKLFLNFVKNLQDVSVNPEDYPLHKAVLNRNLYKIRQICIGDDSQFFHIFIDQVDPLGNTALMLAVKLKLYDEVQVLIDHGADPKYRLTNSIPSPLEVAVEMHDQVLVTVLVAGYHRDLYLHWSDNIESFSQALLKLEDFSIKMSWECRSNFIPFLKKFTPSDTYRITKIGNKVKIDLTLVGWEQLRAKRGQISIVFNGDYNRVLLVDHSNNTSRELFGDLNYEQIQKHAKVKTIKDLLKNKKYSTDLIFSECNVEPCRTWRGYEQTKEISGYTCKKHEISCGVLLNIHKRPVLIEKQIQSVKTFSDYSKLITDKNCKCLILSDKIEKVSEKHLKVSSWSSQSFPLKLSDFLPIIELLSSVSQKAKRFSELLHMQNMIQALGFPLRTKIPVVLTVTALVVFKDFERNCKGDLGFEKCLKLTVESFEVRQIVMQRFERESEEDTVIGPKVSILPTPQMENEEAEATFVKDFGIFEEEVKQRIRVYESHREIIKKVKSYVESYAKRSNDVDVVIF